jgi:NADH-quinone oxidoreductase subunit J
MGCPAHICFFLLMPVETILFGLTAFLVLASAIMVITSRHPVHSALFLVLTFLGLAAFYLQLNASFIAAVQVIVYAGAIMVLFVFVIMLLGINEPIPGERGAGISKWLGAVFALGLVLELGYLLSRAPVEAGSTPGPVRVVASAGEVGQSVPFGSIKAVGNTLFTQYLFAFEATSIVLLVAMIGIVVLAKRRL